MDTGLTIAHMEFGEVASYLLGDMKTAEEVQTEKKSEIGKNVENSNSRKGYLEGSTASRISDSATFAAKNKRKESVTANLSRTFLAQHALSEIPTLEADVKPFPDMIKTGDQHSEISFLFLIADQ